jgi:AraC-like DNA-binding protein
MPVLLSGKRLYPLQSYRTHKHDAWEIILNLEGCGIDIVDGVEYPFRPGSIVCVPPNMPHSKVSKEKFKDIFIQSSDFFLSDRNETLTFQDDEEKSVEMLMQLAHRAFHKRERNYVNIVESVYDTIQQVLLGKLKNPMKNRQMEQLIDAIVVNFSDPEFRVTDAIAALPYSKDYVRRQFKKETGMTPVSYLNSLRLEQAKKLLKQQSMKGYTISEIALLCGFYDPRYFSRLFKRYTNRSPMSYAGENSH